MTKSELVSKLAKANPSLTQRKVEIIVATIFGEIAAALSRGDRVELRGFGVFSTKRVSARASRNPLTGARVNVPEKHFITFKLGRPMHPSAQRVGAALAHGHARGGRRAAPRRRSAWRTADCRWYGSYPRVTYRESGAPYMG